MAKKVCKCCQGIGLVYTIIAEAAFFGLLYYIQVLLRVSGNLWISTLILWVLANIATMWCPIVRMHKK